MKLTTILTVLFSMFATLVFAQTGSINLTVTSVDSQQGGKLKIGLFNSDGYLEFGEEVLGIDLNIEGPTAKHLLKEVPVGKFVLAVYQDQDSNNKLDKNFFGAPSEPYGFSKNKYGMFGPPDFEDVAFEIKVDEIIDLTINLE